MFVRALQVFFNLIFKHYVFATLNYLVADLNILTKNITFQSLFLLGFDFEFLRSFPEEVAGRSFEGDFEGARGSASAVRVQLIDDFVSGFVYVTQARELAILYTILGGEKKEHGLQLSVYWSGVFFLFMQ